MPVTADPGFSVSCWHRAHLRGRRPRVSHLAGPRELRAELTLRAAARRPCRCAAVAGRRRSSATMTTISRRSRRIRAPHRDRVDMIEQPDVVAVAERHVDRRAGRRHLDVGGNDRLAAADRLAHRPSHARMDDRRAHARCRRRGRRSRPCRRRPADAATPPAPRAPACAPSSSPNGTSSERSSRAQAGERIADHRTGGDPRDRALSAGRPPSPWTVSRTTTSRRISMVVTSRSVGDSLRSAPARPAPPAAHGGRSSPDRARRAGTAHRCRAADSPAVRCSTAKRR